MKLSALTPPMVQHLYNEAMEQAMRLGYVRTNPCEACELPRVEPKQIKPLEGDDVKAFLQAIRGTANEELLFIVPCE